MKSNGGNNMKKIISTICAFTVIASLSGCTAQAETTSNEVHYFSKIVRTPDAEYSELCLLFCQDGDDLYYKALLPDNLKETTGLKYMGYSTEWTKVSEDGDLPKDSSN